MLQADRQCQPPHGLLTILNPPLSCAATVVEVPTGLAPPLNANTPPATGGSPPPGPSPPSLVQSGKQRRIQRRHAADRPPGQALVQLAFNTSSKTGCSTHDFYQRKRAEGKAHHTALPLVRIPRRCPCLWVLKPPDPTHPGPGPPDPSLDTPDPTNTR